MKIITNKNIAVMIAIITALLFFGGYLVSFDLKDETTKSKNIIDSKPNAPVEFLQ